MKRTHIITHAQQMLCSHFKRAQKIAKRKLDHPMKHLAIALGLLWAIDANASDLHQAVIVPFTDVPATQNRADLRFQWYNHTGQTIYVTKMLTELGVTNNFTGSVLVIPQRISDGGSNADNAWMDYLTWTPDHNQTEIQPVTYLQRSICYSPDAWTIVQNDGIECLVSFTDINDIPGGQTGIVGSVVVFIHYRTNP